MGLYLILIQMFWKGLPPLAFQLGYMEEGEGAG